MNRTTATSAQRRAPIGLLLGSSVLALGLGLAAAIDPLLGLGGFVFLAAMFSFVRNGAVAVCAFAGTTYFDLIGEYTGAALSPIKLAGGALIVLALMSLAIQRSSLERAFGSGAVAALLDGAGPAWRRHPVIVGLVFAFVAWAVASVAWAENLDQVKSLSTRLITDGLIFLAVPVFLRRAQHIRALSWTLLCCASAAALVGTLMNANIMGRAIGTFTDPNEYAAALVPAIALAIPIVENSASTFERWFGRALIAYCIIGVMESGSRGGMLALVIAFVAIVVGARGVERIRFAGVSLIGIAAGLGWLVLTPTGSSIFARITDGDSSGRSSLWKVAIRQFEAHPFTGVGIGNYPATAHQYLAGISDLDLFLRDPRVVHSTPLELLAELGAVGFALYYAFVIACLWCGMRAVRIARVHGDQLLQSVSRGVVAATLSAVASTVFLSGQYQELAWVLFACCVVTLVIAQRQAAFVDAETTLAADELAQPVR